MMFLRYPIRVVHSLEELKEKMLLCQRDLALVKLHGIFERVDNVIVCHQARIAWKLQK